LISEESFGAWKFTAEEYLKISRKEKIWHRFIKDFPEEIHPVE
jgi:hypothetical protein